MYLVRLEDGVTMERSPQCREFWERVAQSYERRWQATKDAADQAAAADARQKTQVRGR